MRVSISHETLIRFNSIGGWMMGVGMLIAIGYLACFQLFSGDEIGKYRLEKTRGLSSFGPVQLAPEMNPILPRFHAESPRGKYSGSCDLWLLDETEEKVWTDKLRFSRSRAKSKSKSSKDKKKAKVSIGSSKNINKSFKIIRVDKPGAYFFKANVYMTHGRFRNASISLRKNIAETDWPIPVFGFILMAAGGGLLFFQKKK